MARGLCLGVTRCVITTRNNIIVHLRETGRVVTPCPFFFDCIYDYDCKSYQKWKCEEDIPCEYEKRSYHIKETEFGFVMAHSIGETVFLTREAAEKKLEELKNEI